jgi:hypothetical protein
VRHHFKDSVYRVAGLRCLVDFCLHLRLSLGIDAGQNDVGSGSEGSDLLPLGVAQQLGAAHADYVAGDLNAQLSQQQLGKPARGHARRRFARRSSLQHVARVRKVVLQCARQVGVPGPR